MIVRPTHLCSFDGRVDVALGLPLQLFHSEDAFHFLYQLHVAHERRPSFVHENAVGVGIAQCLQEEHSTKRRKHGRTDGQTHKGACVVGMGIHRDARMVETRSDRSWCFFAVGEGRAKREADVLVGVFGGN